MRISRLDNPQSSVGNRRATYFVWPLTMFAALVFAFHIYTLSAGIQLAKGRVEGVALDAVSGLPVSNVQVQLTPRTESAQPVQDDTNRIPYKIVQADSQGRFLIEGIEPGYFTLSFTAAGFQTSALGEKVYAGIGALMRVREGESLTGIVMKMKRAASLSGRIVGSDGTPVTEAQVILQPDAYNIDAVRIAVGTSTRTDDRGEFRFSGIRPGQYRLIAGPGSGSILASARAGPETRSAIRFGYAWTYYPEGRDSNLAELIEIKSGSDIAGLRLMLEKQKFYSIRGRVVNPAGPLPSTASVAALHRIPVGAPDSGVGPPTQEYDSSTGVFTLGRIEPGTWYVKAIEAGPGRASGAGTAVVVITDSDFEGLTLTLPAGVNVTGRLRVAAQSAATSDAMSGIQVRLVETRDNGTRGLSQVPNPDGRFTLQNVPPGNYRVALGPLPANYYVASALLDGTDVLRKASYFDGTKNGVLEIALNTDGGQVDGVATAGTILEAADVDAVLVPNQRDRIDLYRAVKTDQSGRFSLNGIAPGEYKIYAWGDMQVRFSYFDSNFMKRFDMQGEPVVVTSGSRLRVQPKVIRVPQL